ncbi:hypothetical protein JCM3774_000407 [Rhodotorula dairenensis]
MSDTTSEGSHNSVEGGVPPSTDTSSSWPETEISKSEGGGAPSTSVSPASSSLPSSLQFGQEEPAAAGVHPSTPPVSSDTATECRGAGTARTPDTSPLLVDSAEAPVTPPSSNVRVVRVQDDGRSLGINGNDATEVGAPSTTASGQGDKEPGDGSETTLTPTSATANARQSCKPDKPVPKTGILHDEDKSDGKRHGKAQPAFLLTRPTDNGRNEETSLPPPSSPTSSSPGQEQAQASTSALPSPRSERTCTQQAPGSSRPIPPITTLLPDIEHFSASPVAVTATSPRTRAFFDAELSATVRSPPRPGGAVITEIASDTEFTIVEAKTEHRGAAVAEAQSREAEQAQERCRNVIAEEPLRQCAESRFRTGKRFEPAGQSSRHSVRLPFVIGRTVVSADVPRLMRAESLRQQRLRDYDRQLELERQREKLRILAQRQLQEEQRDREREREREQARLMYAAAVRLRQPEEARKQPREPQRPDPPASRDSPLQALIVELKAGLEADPAVYYAVRGVLHEYEEHTGRAPARASSVDGPSDRAMKLKQRAREANRRERANELSRHSHRRRPQVSFDEDTTATERDRERPHTLSSAVAKARNDPPVGAKMATGKTAIEKPAKYDSRSAGLLRHAATMTSLAADQAPRHVGAPTAIKFSLADIQPREPASHRGAPASGTGSTSRPPATLQRLNATAKKSAATRMSTVPYGHARRPGLRDDSITFDFDDFYE